MRSHVLECRSCDVRIVERNLNLVSVPEDTSGLCEAGAMEERAEEALKDDKDEHQHRCERIHDVSGTSASDILWIIDRSTHSLDQHNPMQTVHRFP
jgi:hypothetical protein